MFNCDTLIRNATVLDGTGAEGEVLDVALLNGRIHDVAPRLGLESTETVDAEGMVLAPGFIDAHTHDDTSAIETPEMLPKISQGVTTVIVGNCGISASPVTLRGTLPDPMNLLGAAGLFSYPTFDSYLAAIEQARPAVNVGALVGHTSLRNNHMDRLDRAATVAEIAAMQAQLRASLETGALGLSTGLAYMSAIAAPTEEVVALAQPLGECGGIYVTHLRSETDSILDAMREAFTIGHEARIPVIISHLKCAGIDNWGRSGEVIHELDAARTAQDVGFDCYPYTAGSSTLDLRQVDERVEITITWSAPHPEVAGRSLDSIAAEWRMTQLAAARLMQPAGAIYHSISDDDMRRFLTHPGTMIGSDGLPHDPKPHPRLWGTFPRVLGRYCRDLGLFPLATAIHKMTLMPAKRFGLAGRGQIRKGYFADLVLFDPEKIVDTATFAVPVRPANGILRVWVNGVLSYTDQGSTQRRAGRFLPRSTTPWVQ